LVSSRALAMACTTSGSRNIFSVSTTLIRIDASVSFNRGIRGSINFDDAFLLATSTASIRTTSLVSPRSCITRGMTSESWINSTALRISSRIAGSLWLTISFSKRTPLLSFRTPIRLIPNFLISVSSL